MTRRASSSGAPTSTSDYCPHSSSSGLLTKVSTWSRVSLILLYSIFFRVPNQVLADLRRLKIDFHKVMALERSYLGHSTRVGTCSYVSDFLVFNVEPQL